MNAPMDLARQWLAKAKNDLLLLLEEILPHSLDAETLRDDLASLMPYAVGVRYPGEFFMPTHQDACDAREAARNVMDWLRSHLEGLFP